MAPSRSDTYPNSAKMLEVKEADRANFEQIASHPFFSEIDMAKVLRKEYPGKTIPMVYNQQIPLTKCAYSSNPSV